MLGSASGPRHVAQTRLPDGSYRVRYDWDFDFNPYLQSHLAPWKWAEICQREGIRQAVDAWENEGGR